jgi:hypothetical protein
MEDGKTWRVHSDEEIIEALNQAYGIISDAAKSLDMDRKSLDYRIKTHPNVKEACQQAREGILDASESVLYDLVVKEHNYKATAFLLRTLGKSRGYGDELKITANNNNLNANVDLSVLSEEDLEKLNDILTRTIKNSDELLELGSGSEGIGEEEFIPIRKDSLADN